MSAADSGPPGNDYARSNTLASGLDYENALLCEQTIPEAWSLCVHPQGWIYFHNASLKVVVDYDIRTPENLAAVYRSIGDYPLNNLEDDMEVHLHVQNEDKGPECVILFSLAINHKHCVASYSPNDITEANCVFPRPQNSNRARRLYWNYLYNHPTHVKTPERALRDAADALTCFYTDNMIMGVKSTAPFSKAECEELTVILKDFTKPYHEDSISKTVFLSWVLREVCRYRNAESYGVYTFKEALLLRQARQSTVNPPVPLEHSSPMAFMLLNLVINCVFFGIPRTYWVHIKTTSEFRGRLSAVQQNWDSYIERLVREYSHFLLIGFFPWTIFPRAQDWQQRFQALTSMSSIIIGVFSIWRHQANTSTKHSYTYMHNVQHSAFGIPGHAILLSLPPTLLVAHAIIGFTVALLAYVAQGATSPDQWGRISTAALLGIFAVLLSAVLLALYTFSIIWTLQRRRRPSWSCSLFRSKNIIEKVTASRPIEDRV
ncbi:hypothetical protein DFP72DRAFT_878635 [Ephemerocybe angulata]|uniref:Uncharacterized protein n=1 Tax=Ephemerocybe angulata TaxID=980116 RepID=A0A8H6MFL1_9AGAR|nr:hypothetical protein DFP72DRAFT_878635 [Tulosesus angulatus]